MKKSTVTISYNEEKLSALRLFLSQKNLELDTELECFLDTLFKKTVPSSVRDFLEMKDMAVPEKTCKILSAP